ncbi:MAG: UDP-2,3-diacylglucosamine diphosphatase [Lysobacteraceae bacterium]|nr:MAG: UDP-2,3-diacylglucosamine diphosphatase [Xanthomonadaceae bacterium]
MTTLFISDLHLDASRPHITQLFVAFLRNEAARADALYILGDLFEAWIGDDAPDPTGDIVAAALAELHGHGVPCFYIHGNRDFLLGDAYARRARMTLLPDPSVVEIEGERVLLMHGDTLCTDDAPYQTFRAKSHTAAWQRAFLARPVTERQAFAAQARAESQRYTQSVELAITDVNADAVASAFALASVRKLVHGHTHRPARHALEAAGKPAERIVLGDWYDHESMLELRRSEAESGVGFIALSH